MPATYTGVDDAPYLRHARMGVFDQRKALFLLRKKWAAVTDPNTPCPINLSLEEMKEHER